MVHPKSDCDKSDAPPLGLRDFLRCPFPLFLVILPHNAGSNAEQASDMSCVWRLSATSGGIFQKENLTWYIYPVGNTAPVRR